MAESVLYDVSLFTDHDIYLFKEGSHSRLYEKLGSHVITHKGQTGTLFSVWAPNARQVTVLGDFNGWDRKTHPLAVRPDGSGIWEGFVPGIGRGEVYKYFICSKYYGYEVEKGDPFALTWEIPPKTASVVWDDAFDWNDADWMNNRPRANGFSAPVSIYEMHLGSWKRHKESWHSLSYLEMAEQLPAHLTRLGFTHVEFLPVMEHPFYGSWGYQTVGYFAPSSRYGTPQDFMALVDALHRAGIGVILDWVPSHFPADDYGLAYFDGTHLYEHADPRQGYHPDWKSYIFNYGRNEVRAFLLSSAAFWLERFHADGLRVDAVASMLYLDYSRNEGEWVPNIFGGKENLEAIAFLRKLNETAYTDFPGIETTAEESTDWPLVTRPPYLGGLGFGMKWNMGWMHDTLRYMSLDPVFRKYHHGHLSFSIWYAFNENYILPLSHDEVVHGKGSLFGKMPGDSWRKLAGLRLLYGYMWGHPGKKLLFMGGELGQPPEWNHDGEIEWHLEDVPGHAGVARWLADLNAFYRSEPALHERDFSRKGFEWVNFVDADQSVLAFLRLGKTPGDMVLAVFNFTPVPRKDYSLGAPLPGLWEEALNSDSALYGGSDMGNSGLVEAKPEPHLDRPCTLTLTLPPLGALFFKPRR